MTQNFLRNLFDLIGVSLSTIVDVLTPVAHEKAENEQGVLLPCVCCDVGQIKHSATYSK